MAVSLSNKIPSYLIVKLFFSVVQIGGGRVAKNTFVRFPLHSFSSQVAFLKLFTLVSVIHLKCSLQYLIILGYVLLCKKGEPKSYSDILVQRKLWNSALDEEACQPASSEAKQAPQSQPFMCCVTVVPLP